MIEIGRYNKLRILRETSVGLYLGDENGEDVLLPNKYCPKVFEIDDEIEVFVYLDYGARKVATNLTPKIQLHEFALLEVAAVDKVGVFLDWGLEKHLLVPFGEQTHKMQLGKSYVVYLDVDEKSNRLYASAKIGDRLQNDILTVAVGDEVELMTYQETDLGFSVIINGMHEGLVFKNEVFKPLNDGDVSKGYIKKVRDNNKVDVSLQPIGYEHSNDQNSDAIYQALTASNGFLPYTDKSAPEDIYRQFGMSKKAFKKAVGNLYKLHKITIEKDGIKVNG